MDAVTYPHHDVRAELRDHWIERKLDVTEWKAVAAAFGVTAVPMAVLVSPSGRILGRLDNFIEPHDFVGRLHEARADG